MSSVALTFFVVACFLVAFPLFWYGVVYLVSLFGWRDLAASFATNQPMPSDMQLGSGMINIARYNGTLRIKADDRGLWLKTLVLFSPGHKPLFIPWSAIQQYTNGGWIYQSKFTVKGITIRLKQDLKPWLNSDSQEFV